MSDFFDAARDYLLLAVMVALALVCLAVVAVGIVAVWQVGEHGFAIMLIVLSVLLVAADSTYRYY